MGSSGAAAMLASMATSLHFEPGLPIMLAYTFPVVSTLKNADHPMYGTRSGFLAASQARSVVGSVGLASALGASAAASASPSAKRSAGSRARQRSIAAPSLGGSPGAARSTLGAASVACRTSNAGRFDALKGRRPLTARYPTTPSA